MRLADAMNTWGIATLLIEEKGYELADLVSDDREECIGFIAFKNGQHLVSDTPLSLLGLITLTEEYGKNENPLLMANRFIHQKGYHLYEEFEEPEKGNQPGRFLYYGATGSDKQLFASDLLSLSALIVIAEKYGENWQSVKTKDYYDDERRELTRKELEVT